MRTTTPATSRADTSFTGFGKLNIRNPILAVRIHYTARIARRNASSTRAAGRASGAASSARSCAATGSSSPSSSAIGRGSHRSRAAHWKRDPARTRRWEMPTTFFPPTVTSPGPRPAKQTCRHHWLHTMAPWCMAACTPTEPSASHQTRPSQWKATPTSASHSASRAGTNTSAHTTSPGPTSTAPPPLRRRTTSAPRPATAGWVLPSTSAGAVTSTSRTVRLKCAGSGRPCTSEAVPRTRSTAHSGALPLDFCAFEGVICPSAHESRRWSGRQRRSVLEVGLPVGVHRADGHDDPRELLGRRGRAAQGEADLVEEAVLLLGVARPAGGDDVLPDVLATPAAGDDVVDVLGRRTAVLAAVAVASEDSPAVQRGAGAERHLDEVGQADHRGHGEGGPLGVQLLVGGVEDLGLLLQDEDDGAPHGHNAEGLVGRVQHQRLGHGSAPDRPCWWNLHGPRRYQPHRRSRW